MGTSPGAAPVGTGCYGQGERKEGWTKGETLSAGPTLPLICPTTVVLALTSPSLSPLTCDAGTGSVDPMYPNSLQPVATDAMIAITGVPPEQCHRRLQDLLSRPHTNSARRTFISLSPAPSQDQPLRKDREQEWADEPLGCDVAP